LELVHITHRRDATVPDHASVFARFALAEQPPLVVRGGAARSTGPLFLASWGDTFRLRSKVDADCSISPWAGWSFPRSFHPAPLAPTEAHWLDDRSDLSCQDARASTPWMIRVCLVNSRLGVRVPQQLRDRRSLSYRSLGQGRRRHPNYAVPAHRRPAFSLRSMPLGVGCFASRGSWVRVPSSPPTPPRSAPMGGAVAWTLWLHAPGSCH